MKICRNLIAIMCFLTLVACVHNDNSSITLSRTDSNGYRYIEEFSIDQTDAQVLNGPVVVTRSTGEVLWKYSNKDGQMHGTWTMFDHDGRKIRQVEYEHGLKFGKQTKWFFLRKVRIEENYYKGLLHGPAAVYTFDGVLLQQSTYLNGVRHGVRILINTEANSVELTNVRNGKRVGEDEYLPLSDIKEGE